MEAKTNQVIPAVVLARLALINATIERTEPMGPHFTKFHLTNGQVVHHLLPDAGEEFHTHPWPFDGEVLYGRYREVKAFPQADGTVVFEDVWRNTGDCYRTEAALIHRIPEMPLGEVWTLVRPGAWEGHPGFYKFDEFGVWFRFHWESVWQLEAAKAY